MAGQIGRAGPLDHFLEEGFRVVETLIVVVESAFTAVPEVSGRQRLSCRVRRHAADLGQLAGEWLESPIPAPLDGREARSLPVDPPDPVRTHRIADDFEPQVVCPREVGHVLDLDRDLAY